MRMIKVCAMSLPLMLVTAVLPAHAQSRAVSYQCDGGRSFEAEYTTQPNQARLTMGTAQPTTLAQVPSADGARYSDGTTTLFTKGNDAFIEENGKTTYNNCIAQSSPGTEQQSTSSTSTSQQSTSNEQTAGQPTSGQTTMGESSTSGQSTSQSSNQQTVIRRSTTTQQQTVIRRSTPAPTAQTPPQQTAAPAEQPAPQALW